MKEGLRRQQIAVAEDVARLTQHRAATRAGEAVIAETRGRAAQGLLDLQDASAALDAAMLGVEAVRSRRVLESLRADLGRLTPAPAARLTPLDGAAIDPVTGVRIGRSGAYITAWSPLRALRPVWTVAGPAGPLRFGGSPAGDDAGGERVVAGDGAAGRGVGVEVRGA